MSKVLVLGATGFIGRNMVKHFAALGHDVHAVRYKRDACDSNVTWTQADLREPFDLSGYDIVIHAAATTSGSKDIVNNPALHVTDNAVMGSYIFRAAVEAKVKHVIFFSCSTMFSNGDITEESPIDTHPKYFGVAHTKLYLEKLCDFYSRVGDTKFTAIRHSNIYGPHDKFDLERSHFFGATMTKVMRATWDNRPGAINYIPDGNMSPDEIQKLAKEGSSVKIWGTGEEARDLLHVDDLCRFVELAVEKQPEKFGLYNCGYGIAFKVKDVVQKIIDASGKSLVIEHDLSAPSIPTSLSLNCDKARKELEWNPMVTLPEGIKKTLEWWKSNAA